MEADPGETHTLIDDPAHARILYEHRALLDRHITETEDPFLSMEWMAAERLRSHEPGYRCHRGPAAPMANIAL